MADQDSTNLRHPRIWVHDDCPADLVTASRTLAANQPCAEYVHADIVEDLRNQLALRETRVADAVEGAGGSLSTRDMPMRWMCCRDITVIIWSDRNPAGSQVRREAIAKCRREGLMNVPGEGGIDVCRDGDLVALAIRRPDTVETITMHPADARFLARELDQRALAVLANEAAD